MSVLLFVITLWVLVYHRKTERVNKSLVITSCVMMAFGTLHLAIDLTRILQGFVDQRDLPGGPVGYFSQLWLWSHVSKTCVFALQTVLADSFAVCALSPPLSVSFENMTLTIIRAVLIDVSLLGGMAPSVCHRNTGQFCMRDLDYLYDCCPKIVRNQARRGCFFRRSLQLDYFIFHPNFEHERAMYE